MVETVQIKNFKSIVDLKLELGAFNVLIGENGCGKSNILEALAFGAAASADKLDFEFLGSRGIRVTNPEYMFSAFKNLPKNDRIGLDFSVKGSPVGKYRYELLNSHSAPKSWMVDQSVRKYVAGIVFDKNKNIGQKERELESLGADEFSTKSLISAIEILNKQLNDFQDDGKKNILKELNELFVKTGNSNDLISNYILYSPEESSLRKFEDTAQIYPLGIKGEGLFQYLKELTSDKDKIEILNSIKKNLSFLDWYESFEVPDKLMRYEYSLQIKDRYLDDSLQYFDQRSANEGFLYLLFYFTLFIAKETPQFFAIDNIDASLNPKLCRQLTEKLAELTTEHKKQVIVTTQNPAILDGLNLADDNQRLFVVRRNEEGHTIARRIEHKAKRKMKLSEIWTNGFIGGLPENF